MTLGATPINLCKMILCDPFSLLKKALLIAEQTLPDIEGCINIEFAFWNFCCALTEGHALIHSFFVDTPFTWILFSTMKCNWRNSDEYFMPLCFSFTLHDEEDC